MKTRRSIDLYMPSRVAYHVKIVLGSIFIIMFFNTMWRGNPFVEEFWYMLGLTIIQLEIFMAIAFRMFPQVEPGRKYKRKILVRLALFYLLVLVIAIVFLFLAISVGVMAHGGSFSDVLHHFVSYELRNFLISMAVGLGIGALAFFYFEWAKSLKREQKLNEEKLIFQYETLKNQVNPHFLFNSLNTLSSLVSKDPELSEQFISRFSSIYRYILEKKDQEMVSLVEELDFVKNYFFLQRIRDDGKIDLQIDVDAQEHYKVLPISLQLLIENALKHNAATMESPLKIRVYPKGNDVLVVENNLQPKMQMESSSKIGLKNLKERIWLVMHKELEIIRTEDTFSVHLPAMKTTP